MSGRRPLQVTLLILKHLKDPYYQGFAAQLAFYFILSIVPVMIVLSQILGLFSISLSALDDLINQYVSDDVTEILMDFITYKPTGAVNFALIIVALWSASKVQFSMIRITNYTMTEGQSTGGGFFRDRLRAMKTVLFTLLTVACALIILVYGEPMVRLFLSAVNMSLSVGYEINKILLVLRWPALFTLFFLMVSYNYYVLPYIKVKFREVLPGSIFASVAMIVITYLYSLYTRYAGHFDIIYGSLASAVALMFWFFFLSWALGLGVLVNKAWSDTKTPIEILPHL